MSHIRGGMHSTSPEYKEWLRKCEQAKKTTKDHNSDMENRFYERVLEKVLHCVSQIERRGKRFGEE